MFVGRPSGFVAPPILAPLAKAVSAIIVGLRELAATQRTASNDVIASTVLGSASDVSSYSDLGLHAKHARRAIISSPPYATALPYIDTDRLSIGAAWPGNGHRPSQARAGAGGQPRMDEAGRGGVDWICGVEHTRAPGFGRRNLFPDPRPEWPDGWLQASRGPRAAVSILRRHAGGVRDGGLLNSGNTRTRFSSSVRTEPKRGVRG